MIRKIKSFTIFLFLIVLMACQPSLYHFDHQKEVIPEVVFEKKEIDVAIVLGGGGARGMFHVGVLEVLEQAKIPIDLIVGCSAGAIVGALYADNPNGQYVKNQLISLRCKDFLEFSFFNCRYGFCNGFGIRNFLKSKLAVNCFEDLQVPFLVVATDLDSGEVLKLGSGPIIPAVHASCAVPFFFEPVKLHGRVLVDGGVLDPNPVAAAKDYFPKMIIAVDLSELLPVTKPNHLFGVATRSAELIHLKQSRKCLDGADIIIRPTLHPIGMFDDSHTEKLYLNGKKATQALLPQILERYEKCRNHP